MSTASIEAILICAQKGTRFMSLLSFRSSLIGMLLGLLAGGAASAGENWPSFHRGGNTSVEATNLPLKWTPKAGIDWRLDLPGYGQSAPVVWQDRIFLTAVAGDNKETNLVLAFDTESGKSLWEEKFSATVTTKNSYMVSRAAPTLLADPEGVYALFESGDLHALSHSGRLRWHRSLFDNADRAFQNSHGYGASPAQTENAVIVLVDHRGPSYLTAISKQTGRPLWKTERSSRSSWTSPHVTRVRDQSQVVVSSAGSVDGYDANTGQELWSHEGLGGNLIPSATVQGDRVYVGASIARDDSNAQSAAASNCCLRIAPGEGPGYELLWGAEKAVCDYASPLVHRGCVYYVNKVGVLYCLEAATGRQCYVQRIGNPCWAQPIATGDHVYFFGKHGVATVIRAGSTFELLASNRLWSEEAPPRPDRSYEYEPQDENDPRPRQPSQEYLDPIVYAVAAVDDAFFVRLGTHLYRIGGRAGNPSE